MNADTTQTQPAFVPGAAVSIRDKIRAAYPGLFLLTHEKARAEAVLTRVADELSYHLFGLSITVGRFDAKTGENARNEADSMAVLDAVVSLPEKSLLILRDFHAFFVEPNPCSSASARMRCSHAKTANRTLILLGSELNLPPEMEKRISVFEIALPSRGELRTVLVNLCEQNEKLLPENEDAVLDALGGLPPHEAEDALSLSIIEAGEFVPAILAREKANMVKKNARNR